MVSFTQTQLVTCDQLLYFPIFRQRELSRVFYSRSRDEVYLSNYFATNLHLIYAKIGNNFEITKKRGKSLEVTKKVRFSATKPIRRNGGMLMSLPTDTGSSKQPHWFVRTGSLVRQNRLTGPSK